MTSLIGDDFWVTIGFVSLVASPLCLYSLYVGPDDERRRSYPKVWGMGWGVLLFSNLRASPHPPLPPSGCRVTASTGCGLLS